MQNKTTNILKNSYYYLKYNYKMEKIQSQNERNIVAQDNIIAEKKYGKPITEKADLVSRFETTQKTIDNYIQEIYRYNRYKSMYSTYSGILIDDRSRLIDLYEMALEQDAHIKATIETLESQMMGDRYSLGTYKEDGTYQIDQAQTEKIQGTAFDVAIRGIMEAKLFGYTVLEIFPYIDSFSGKISHIKSVERRNILPNQHSVIANINDRSSKKFDLYSEKYMDNYILIKTEDLGLFSTTTPLVLAKKFALSSYVNFTNTYGMPIIHAKSSEISANSRRSLASAVAKAVNDRVVVTGLDDTIDIKSMSVSNSERIYIGLLDIVNRDISNVVLGSESMAGATQSYVGSTKAHQDIFRDRISVYRKFIENIMNEQVIPRLVKMNYIKEGLVFRYNKRVDMSMEEKLNILKLLIPNFDVPEEYFLAEFGISVTKKDFGDDGYEGTGGDVSTEKKGRKTMSPEEYFKRYGRERGAGDDKTSENTINIVNALKNIYKK